MKIEELKSVIQSYRERLEDKEGKVCVFGKDGPVGMRLIDALVKTLEAQERRIQILEKKASS
jgi:hypothetical protein